MDIGTVSTNTHEVHIVEILRKGDLWGYEAWCVDCNDQVSYTDLAHGDAVTSQRWVVERAWDHARGVELYT